MSAERSMLLVVAVDGEPQYRRFYRQRERTPRICDATRTISLDRGLLILALFGERRSDVAVETQFRYE